MAVRDVWAPKDKKEIDPKVAPKEKESGEAEYWKVQRDKARAKREFEAEEREARRAEEIERNPPEPPIQIRGSVDLGHFDMQEQQKQLQERVTEIQNEAKNEIARLNKEASDYRDQVYKIQLAMTENTLKAQIENLQHMIREGQVKPKEPGVIDQINQISQIAGILGYRKMDESEGLPSEVRLKMFEMEMNENQATRKFEWDKMMSERSWQLELKKLEAESQARMAEIQKERDKRDSMIASPIQMLGSAIAQGLLNHGGEPPKAPSVSKRKKSGARLTAEEDDSGTVNCPECQQPIAIAPKARSAVCANCGLTIPIDRIPT